MNSWSDFLMNSSPLRRLFGEIVIGGQGLVIHDLLLSRDGPSVHFRLDLREFPADAPEKWVAARFNRVQLRLAATGVEDLQVTGLSPVMTADLSIIVDGARLRLSLVGSGLDVRLTADAVVLDSVSAYRDEGIQ